METAWTKVLTDVRLSVDGKERGFKWLTKCDDNLPFPSPRFVLASAMPPRFLYTQSSQPSPSLILQDWLTLHAHAFVRHECTCIDGKQKFPAPGSALQRAWQRKAWYFLLQGLRITKCSLTGVTDHFLILPKLHGDVGDASPAALHNVHFLPGVFFFSSNFRTLQKMPPRSRVKPVRDEGSAAPRQPPIAKAILARTTRLRHSLSLASSLALATRIKT